MLMTLKEKIISNGQAERKWLIVRINRWKPQKSPIKQKEKLTEIL